MPCHLPELRDTEKKDQILKFNFSDLPAFPVILKVMTKNLKKMKTTKRMTIPGKTKLEKLLSGRRPVPKAPSLSPHLTYLQSS